MLIKLNPISVHRSLECELFVLNLFQTMTVNPISIKRKKTWIFVDKESYRHKLSYIIVIFALCVLASIVSVLQYHQMVQDFRLEWNDLINFYIIVIACIVVVIESNNKNKLFKHFFKIKGITENELSRLYGSHLYNEEKFLFLKKYMCTFIAFQMFVGFLEILNMIMIDNVRMALLYFLCQITPLLYLRIRFFQHYFHILSINLYMKLLRSHIERHIFTYDQIEKMTKALHFSYIRLNHQSIIGDICLTQHIFNAVLEMVDLINDMFNFSLLSILTVSFLQFFANISWMYLQLNDGDMHSMIGEKHFFVVSSSKEILCFQNFAGLIYLLALMDLYVNFRSFSSNCIDYDNNNYFTLFV